MIVRTRLTNLSLFACVELRCSVVRIARRGEVCGAAVAAIAGAVFVEGDVEHSIQAVLDPPVRPHCRCEVGCVHSRRGSAETPHRAGPGGPGHGCLDHVDHGEPRHRGLIRLAFSVNSQSPPRSAISRAVSPWPRSASPVTGAPLSVRSRSLPGRSGGAFCAWERRFLARCKNPAPALRRQTSRTDT